MKKNIDQIRAELVEAIRQRSLEQIELWKRVPWLALQAEGRRGYTDEGTSRYASGYLRLLPENGVYKIFLDLDTGELCDSYHPINLANDRDVIKLTESDINARDYVDELIERGQQETLSMYDADKVRKWREKMIEEYGITTRYERKRPRAETTKFSWD